MESAMDHHLRLSKASSNDSISTLDLGEALSPVSDNLFPYGEDFEMDSNERQVSTSLFQHYSKPVLGRNHVENTFGILPEPKTTTPNSSLPDHFSVPHEDNYYTRSLNHTWITDTAQTQSRSWQDPIFRGIESPGYARPFSRRICEVMPPREDNGQHNSPHEIDDIPSHDETWFGTGCWAPFNSLWGLGDTQGADATWLAPASCSWCDDGYGERLLPNNSYTYYPGLTGSACSSDPQHPCLCPHLEFSYADVEAWATSGPGNGESYFLQCKDLFCHFYDAKISYRNLGACGDEITITWSAFPEIIRTRWSGSLEGQFLDDCLEKLRGIYIYCPGAFCPHLQKSFYESVNRNALEKLAVRRRWGMQYRILCSEPGCAASIACSLPRGDVRSLSNGTISFFNRVKILPGMRDSNADWIQTLDLDS